MLVIMMMMMILIIIIAISIIFLILIILVIYIKKMRGIWTPSGLCSGLVLPVGARLDSMLPFPPYFAGEDVHRTFLNTSHSRRSRLAQLFLPYYLPKQLPWYEKESLKSIYPSLGPSQKSSS